MQTCKQQKVKESLLEIKNIISKKYKKRVVHFNPSMSPAHRDKRQGGKGRKRIKVTIQEIQYLIHRNFSQNKKK